MAIPPCRMAPLRQACFCARGRVSREVGDRMCWHAARTMRDDLRLFGGRTRFASMVSACQSGGSSRAPPVRYVEKTTGAASARSISEEGSACLCRGRGVRHAPTHVACRGCRSRRCRQGSQDRGAAPRHPRAPRGMNDFDALSPRDPFHMREGGMEMEIGVHGRTSRHRAARCATAQPLSAV